MGARAQAFGSSLAASQVHQQGPRLEVEQPEFELVPIWDAF